MPKFIEQSARPVIFGEVLFDHYPDGKRLLGGAPFNVAWHLQGFGLRPVFVTRLGQDSEGELALTAMIRWGLDTCAVQIDHQHQTGSVIVNPQDGDNQFEIPAKQAWDFISGALVMEWLKHLPCSLIYAGSLAQRSPVSHKTLQEIMLRTQLPIFIDINLRRPWVENSIIEQCLDVAHWLKVSDEEMATLVRETLNSSEKIQQAAIELKTKHDINDVYISCGEQGAILVNDTGMKQANAKSINVMDTVGAGDAFSAVVILGLQHGWSDFQIINNANEFASRICEGYGGTPIKQGEYDQYLAKWSQA